MSKELHDYELKYSSLDKKAYALVKEVGHFWTYILNSPIVAYVPYLPVKMMLSQALREGMWENLLKKMQEFDIEVRPMKAVKGQGICILMSVIDAVNYQSLSRESIILSITEMIGTNTCFCISRWFNFQ